MKRTTYATLLVALFALVLTFASAASADKVISDGGEGAGEVSNPQGLAVNHETGTLYVADRGNNRINVFDGEGEFEFAFGWGVRDGSAAFQTCTAATTCRKGIAGAGRGQFNGVNAIAVDNDPFSPSFGAIYVMEERGYRVQKFSPAGSFLMMLGGEVNKTTKGNVCPVAPTDVCGIGVQGSGTGQFNERLTNVAIGPAGVVFVTDGTLVGFVEGREKYENRLQKFSPDGDHLETFPLEDADNALVPGGVAVDSTGSFYIDTAEGLATTQKYNSSGELIGTVKASGVFTLDSNDNLFSLIPVAGFLSIAGFDPSGKKLFQFGYGVIERNGFGIAAHHSSSGDIYFAETFADQVVHLAFPPPGPVIAQEPCTASPVGNSKATLRAFVNPESKETTVSFQYIDQKSFEAEGGFAGPTLKQTPEVVIGSDLELHEASVQATGLVPETEYRCRVIAKNEDNEAGVLGEAGTFTTLDPLEIGDSWASEIGTETATLNADVNPLGIPTTGRFQYVEDATYQKDIAELGPEHGFDHAKLAPESGEIDYGSGESFKTGSVALSGLAPGTVYRFRIQAKDPFIEFRSGEVRAFRTFLPGEEALPDGRAYELVSPAQKNSAEVGAQNAASGLVAGAYMKILQASPDGEGITYTSFTAFADPESAPGASQYVSRRGGTGWGTRNVTPPTRGGNPLRPPFQGFNAHLTAGAVAVKEPLLAPGAPEGFESLYLRDTETDAYRLLSGSEPTTVPGVEYCLSYGGTSADGSHSIFAANGALRPGDPVANGFNLYEWSPEGGLALVSRLPGEAPAPPTLETALGGKGGGCGVGLKTLRNAVSDDGSKIFWTYVPKTGATRLLARLGGAETIQLDAKAGGIDPSGGGQYWAASADGSKVFFTAQSRLVPGARAGALYRYDFDAAPGERLSDLTIEPVPGPAAAAVQGVLGASEGGDYVYFVANGVLAPGASPGNCSGESGTCSLYLWHEGEGVEFIATLVGKDSSDWEFKPAFQTARVSPDGRHLAFLSRAGLTGYDNTISSGSGCEPNGEGGFKGSSQCAEAYLYSADSGDLLCASCNPSGSRPLGPTFLPTWGSPFVQPRYLSDDGGRLFFETLDSLLPWDTNGARDVYEFESEGVGSCSSASLGFNAESGGCVYLISTGQSEDESYLLDASSNGRDVFFSTRSRLVGWDENDNYDVYDARIGGGFPEPPPPPPLCQGEACKAPPAPPPPPAPAAATPNFVGPPNAVQKPRKPKAKHKSKAKKRHAAKKKAKQGKAKQRRRAAQNRRTSR